MRDVPQPLFRAAIAYGHVRDAGGVQVSDRAPDAYRELSGHGATVLEFRADGETIARKVQASSGEAFWLREDLADKALASLAHEEADNERVIREVMAWRDRTDAENAARRGMDVEAYRRLRLAQGHRQHARSGRNSIGM